MAYAQQEIPDGVDPEKQITQNLYCGSCGFNLRYARFVGRCSECGNVYNARPLKMEGIFLPHSIRFPLVDMVLGVFLCLASFFWIRRGVGTPADRGFLAFGGISAALGVFTLVYAVKQAMRFVRFHGILRRIQCEDD